MIWGMDLKVPWKALSNRGAFSSRRVVFFVVAGLSLVVGIFLRSGQYFGQPDLEQNAPVRGAPPSALGQTPAVEPIELFLRLHYARRSLQRLRTNIRNRPAR